MEVASYILFIFIGFIILIKSADFFVDAAVKVAEISKVPKMIIGATIVSLATTLPEFFVSTSATLNLKNDMAIGNAIGSVIFNTGVILSLAAIFMSGKVDKRNVTEKSLLLILALLLFAAFSWNEVVVWYEGAVLFLLIIVYVYFNVRSVSRKKVIEKSEVIENKMKRLWMYIGILILSAFGIFVGSRILVNNGENLAKYYQLKEQIIGLTIFAIGTSLPELTTTITSIIKKQQSLSVGNVLGANFLNLTLILGFSGVIAQGGMTIDLETLWPFVEKIPQTLWIDLPIAFILISLFVLPMMIIGKLKKWQGIVGLGLYLCYFTYLLINI